MNKLSMIAKGEDQLMAELRRRFVTNNHQPRAASRGVSSPGVSDILSELSLTRGAAAAEAVILEFTRPVLFIQNGKIDVPESDVLTERILKHRAMIERPLGAVGRIEVLGMRSESIGTGWLISEQIVVTNRHVAELFARATNKTGKRVVFRKSAFGDPLVPRIDFKEEHGITSGNNSFEVEVEKVLFLAPEGRTSPDVAILKVKLLNGAIEPIPFLRDRLTNDQFIGIAGYPLKDPRGVLDAAMEERIFGNVFGVKRYAPGQVTNVPDNDWFFEHDASTLGGNSGSLVQDMESGCAIGLHFGGSLLESNFAVKGQAILDLCTKLKINNVFSFSQQQVDEVVVEPPAAREQTAEMASYDDRPGFQARFLEAETGLVSVPLPKHQSRADLLPIRDSETETVLKYRHFSLEMSRSRRMCVYSAVNIDGSQTKKIKRKGWRFDPRIPSEFQIMDACYGNAPKFARGHMTRREDPNWGDLVEAKQGNDDSMHVTNAVPQLQTFNGGTWLKLEDYALENARHDKQRISVFTGPFFAESDPTEHGVRIPVEFWKIIAFIHDETGKLCATGYTISQESHLRNREFVFGEFMTFQVPIKLIEKKARMTFGNLRDADPLKNEIFEHLSAPVESVRQIRFH